MAEPDTSPNHPPKSFGFSEWASIASLVIVFAIMLVSLFWPAGTIDWRRGWLCFSIFVILTFIAIGWLMRDNPELFTVRQKAQKGTKGWDLILTPLIVLGFASILPVGALDDARFHWTPMPDWVVLIGYACLIGGYLGVTWGMAVNRHFESTVRIQTDRGHKLVDTGPYAYIRHPGYAFGVLMVIGIALSLGSLWALIPVAVVSLILAGRTLGEEAVLREGLEGYADYMTRVKYRWLPFVW